MNGGGRAGQTCLADSLQALDRLTSGPVEGAGRFLGFKGSLLRPLNPILEDLKEKRMQQVYYFRESVLFLWVARRGQLFSTKRGRR